MVENYNYDRCRYLLGSLKPVLYLLDRETTRIDYEVGNFKCEVRNIYASNIYKIEGSSTTLNVVETVNNRLDFKTDVKMKLREKWGEPWVVLLNMLKDGDYYVVVEDNNGAQYIQSPEFTSDFTYTYDFNTGSEDGHVAELGFSNQCNFPVVMLNNRISHTHLYTADCAYSTGNVVDFRMCPNKYVILEADRNTGVFTKVSATMGEAMHVIDFTPKSFQFRQQYDGQYYQERLTFKIPLSDYKYYWRYNLVEFQDNKYFVMFKTSEDNWIATGYEFGMQPTYTVETSEERSDLNTITITLQHMSQNSLYYLSERDPEIVDSTTNKFVPVIHDILDPITGEWLSHYFCISKTEALYTLVQMVTESGVPTDRYMCLEGYEELYKNLNIIGTYGRDADFGFPLTFENYDCAVMDNCKFNRLSDTTFTFAKRGDSYNLEVRNPCPWELKNIPDWIDADITSGDGGLTYNITLICKEDGRESGGKKDYAIIQSFDNVTVLEFILLAESEYVNPSTHRITAKAQSVQSRVSWDYEDYDVCEVPQGVSAEKIYGSGGVTITVPENENETGQLMFTVRVCNKRTGDYANITVIQDHLYVKWLPVAGFICVGTDEYEKLEKWKGYTEDAINVRTFETRAGALISSNSSNCQQQTGNKYQEEWIADSETICIGGDLYRTERLRISEDGGVTWTLTDQYRPTTVLIEDSEDCQYIADYEYRWFESRTEWLCDEKDSRYVEYKYFSEDGGTHWFMVKPEERRMGGVRMKNDPECGGTWVDPSSDEKWIETAETVCKDGYLWYLSRLYTSSDGGQTFDETDQYKPTRKTTIECTERPPSDRRYTWCVDMRLYICDGVDAYYAETKYYYFDERPDILILSEPVETRASSVIKKKNSPDCGYVGPDIPTDPTDDPNTESEWRPTDKTNCDGQWLWSLEELWVKRNGTWQSTGQYRQKEKIEPCILCCESIEYKWIVDYSQWMCVGYNAYYVEYYCWKPNTSDIWVRWEPVRYRASSEIYKSNSTECGYDADGEYRWNNNTGETQCFDGDLWLISVEEVSYDGGRTWERTGEVKKLSLLEKDAISCQSIQPVTKYRWMVIEDCSIGVCQEDGNKYYQSVYQYSLDGKIWYDVFPQQMKVSSVVCEYNSPECREDETIYRWVDTGEFICADNNDDYENDPDKPVEPTVEWRKEGFVCEEV